MAVMCRRYRAHFHRVHRGPVRRRNAGLVDRRRVPAINRRKVAARAVVVVPVDQAEAAEVVVAAAVVVAVTAARSDNVAIIGRTSDSIARRFRAKGRRK